MPGEERRGQGHAQRAHADRLDFLDDQPEVRGRQRQVAQHAAAEEADASVPQHAPRVPSINVGGAPRSLSGPTPRLLSALTGFPWASLRHEAVDESIEVGTRRREGGHRRHVHEVVDAAVVLHHHRLDPHAIVRALELPVDHGADGRGPRSRRPRHARSPNGLGRRRGAAGPGCERTGGSSAPRRPRGSPSRRTPSGAAVPGPPGYRPPGATGDSGSSRDSPWMNDRHRFRCVSRRSPRPGRSPAARPAKLLSSH